MKEEKTEEELMEAAFRRTQLFAMVMTICSAVLALAGVALAVVGVVGVFMLF